MGGCARAPQLSTPVRNYGDVFSTAGRRRRREIRGFASAHRQIRHSICEREYLAGAFGSFVEVTDD